MLMISSGWGRHKDMRRVGRSRFDYAADQRAP